MPFKNGDLDVVHAVGAKDVLGQPRPDRSLRPLEHSQTFDRVSVRGAERAIGGQKAAP